MVVDSGESVWWWCGQQTRRFVADEHKRFRETRLEKEKKRQDWWPYSGRTPGAPLQLCL